MVVVRRFSKEQIWGLLPFCEQATLQELIDFNIMMGHVGKVL